MSSAWKAVPLKYASKFSWTCFNLHSNTRRSSILQRRYSALSRIHVHCKIKPVSSWITYWYCRRLYWGYLDYHIIWFILINWMLTEITDKLHNIKLKFIFTKWKNYYGIWQSKIERRLYTIRSSWFRLIRSFLIKYCEWWRQDII